MKPTRVCVALIAAAGLSACATVDTATRNAPAVAPVTEMTAAIGTRSAVQAPYAVQRVDVRVPETLKVSEANTFFPHADIVWREDPLGNRYAQVHDIVQGAADAAVAGATEGRPVILDLQLVRFHALTEKTRYTIGGTHDIHFFLTVFDAETGAEIEAPQLIQLEFEAYGGARALEAMSRGETQKLRISQHVNDAIRAAMHLPDPAQAPAPISLSALN
ncbi:DUF6778 family protein [Actibacterium sp.]|uniref:DUF6778 family protein n=1 Tax=Actibacterium sp. TaxID=1872125 RepID=UPI003567083F